MAALESPEHSMFKFSVISVCAVAFSMSNCTTISQKVRCMSSLKALNTYDVKDSVMIVGLSPPFLIFTAEAKAIDLAFDFITTCDASNKFIIFSDSLSVLKAMNHASSKNPQIQKLLEKCHELLAYKEIALCWIPSHIGIQGNEMVDKQAKTSLSLEPTFF